MSVLINEPPIIAWKDTSNTFSQISAGIRFNAVGSLHENGIFRALPLKIYRKEIATQALGSINPRTSGRVSSFEQPGGTITTTTDNCTGVNNTTEINVTLDESKETISNVCSVFLSPDDNARRRVRSSGMINKRYDSNRNAPNYFTNSQQYLESRSLSYKSNSNFHVYSGDVTVKPGSATTDANLYSSNNTHSPCVVFTLSQNSSFKYLWVDGNEYVVNIPVGSYTITDLNILLRKRMTLNYHYYVVSPSKHKVYLLEINYDADLNKIVIIALNVNSAVTVDWDQAIDPNDIDDNWHLNYVATAGVTTAGGINAHLIFNTGTTANAQLYNAMGVDITGSDVNVPLTNTSSITSSSTELTNETQLTAKQGVQIYYKPNNPGFATQGAVSSSDLITRRKYNAITNVGGSFRSAFGSQTASAVAYGVPANGYTKKDKIGYPIKQTPTFSKYSDIMTCCKVRKFSNAI